MLARELGVADAVRFEGAVPQADVLRYLWAADAFLSSNDLSNVGNPLLEAMACGKPIVTIDNGATGDLIRDGETGILLPSGEPRTRRRRRRAPWPRTGRCGAASVRAREPTRRPTSGRGSSAWTPRLEEVERLVPLSA